MKYCISVDDIEQEEEFLVAIRKYSSEQLHLGLFYKNDVDSKVVHLMNHNDLRLSASTDSYHYINIESFDEMDKTHMIAHIQSLYKINGNELPYGPCGGGSFAESGKYQGVVGEGLTCSLFVLEVLESQGFSFINRESWPKREEDSAWQEGMIAEFNYAFNRDPSDIEHFKEQTRKIGAPRYKPEEVGASVTFESFPNDFATIDPRANNIKSFLCQ